MKNLILLILLSLCITKEMQSQVGIEAQFGGANFFGFTLNGRLDIPLDQMNFHNISTSIGFGMVAPWWDWPAGLVNAGINYRYKVWGAGTEVSIFPGGSFSGFVRVSDRVDVLVYPNFNYTLLKRSGWYFRFSAGAYFAYSKNGSPILDGNDLRFQGDVIPGAGVGVGYMIR